MKRLFLTSTAILALACSSKDVTKVENAGDVANGGAAGSSGGRAGGVASGGSASSSGGASSVAGRNGLAGAGGAAEIGGNAGTSSVAGGNAGAGGVAEIGGSAGNSSAGTQASLGGGGNAGAAGASGCGDTKIQPLEACDDGNQTLCDGCEQCEKRYVLNVPKDSFASIPTLHSYLPAADKTVCFTAWVKTDGSVPNAVYLSSAASETDINFLLQCTPTTLEFMTRNGDTSVNVRPPATCHDGKWHHVGACRVVQGEDINMRLHWDGEIIGSAGAKIDAIGNPAPVYIGGSVFAQNGLGGAIDEISISTRLLPAMTIPLRREEPNSLTVGLYHLDEGTGTTFQGVGENAGTGTLDQATFAIDSGYTTRMCE